MVNSLAVFGGNAEWLGEMLFHTPSGVSLFTSSMTYDGNFNEVAGTTGADKLKAAKGIDNILYGDEGADKLFANTGKDILYGDGPTSGAGTTGEAPAVGAETDFKDTFVFKSLKVLEKSIKKTDVIADFDKLDRIDLSKLTGPELDFIGKAKFSGDGDGEVRFKPFKADGYAALKVDINGDAVTEAR